MNPATAIRFLGNRIEINGVPYKKGHVFKWCDIPLDAFLALSGRADFEIAERAALPETKKPRAKKNAAKDSEE